MGSRGITDQLTAVRGTGEGVPVFIEVFSRFSDFEPFDEGKLGPCDPIFAAGSCNYLNGEVLGRIAQKRTLVRSL